MEAVSHQLSALSRQERCKGYWFPPFRKKRERMGHPTVEVMQTVGPCRKFIDVAQVKSTRQYTGRLGGSRTS